MAPSNYTPNHFGAADVVMPTLQKPTEASVSLTAQWTDDDKQDAVALTANAKFMADFKTAPYRLAFVVIKDNVKQSISNYLTYYKSAYADDDMAEWLTNPYSNPDYALNNVAVAATDVTGIQKSLPTKDIKAGEDNVFETTLDVPVAEGQEEAGNARAIVLLINKDTKEIVNAAITPILTQDEATGIESVSTTAAKSTTVYDLQGRRVAAPLKGLYIIDGKKVVRK